MRRCIQCGKDMNPVQWMLGNRCQECVDKNYEKATGNKIYRSKRKR